MIIPEGYKELKCPLCGEVLGVFMEDCFRKLPDDWKENMVCIDKNYMKNLDDPVIEKTVKSMFEQQMYNIQTEMVVDALSKAAREHKCKDKS